MQTQPNTTLPPGLETFAAGRRIDDSGKAWDFTQAQIADMAAVYDPAVHEAPLTIGHPATDKPAWGFAARFAAGEDGKLRMDTRDVQPQFAEMHRSRRFPKISMAFYSPDHPNNPKPGHWYPRHVAFLGAAPPAVHGLLDPTRTPNFADAGEGLVCFSEATQEDRMSKELQDQAAAEKLRADNATAEAERAKAEARAANERLQQLAQAQATERHAAHVQFAEKAMSEGRLKKPEVPLAVAALDFIGNLESAQVQFSEGGETKNASVLAFVKERIAAGAPLVNFSEQLPGGAGGGGSRGAGGAHGLSDEELDKQAREFSAKHSVSYADALTKVVSFTN